MQLHLCAFSLLLGLAASLPVLDDTSVLIQREHQRQREEKPAPRVCSEEEVEEFKARLAAHKERIKAKKQRTEDQIQQKFQKYLDSGTGRGAAFLAPMLKATENVGKYLDEQVTPVGLNIVKGIMQQLFRGPLVPASKQIDVNKTVNDFLEKWQHEHTAHIKTVLSDGLHELNGRINWYMEANMSKQIQAHLPEVPYPVHNETELRQYLTGKALPVIAANSYPELQEVAQVLARQPTNQSQMAGWVTKELVPTIAKRLPAKCQPARLMTTLGLGMGDVGARVGKFVEACKAAMGILPPDSTEPTRKCSTCVEKYKYDTLEGKNANSCMTHCLPTIASCTSGVNDACIHSSQPCLRCHKKKLEKFDECRGVDSSSLLSSTPLITMLDKLTVAFKDGTVEKEGVQSFLDSVVEALSSAMPATPEISA